MPSPIKQACFVGGEIAPSLYGRTDLARYQQSLALCENWIVRQHGGLDNRPGTKFIREVKDSTAKVRLIPFVWSNEQSYILEFGAGYIRFHYRGATIMDGASPYEVVTAYAVDDLPRLKFCQNADVLLLWHSSYAPQELRRYGHADWKIQNFSVTQSILPPAGFGNFSANVTGNTTHPLKLWQWAVTAVTAEGEESLPLFGTAVEVALYPDMPAAFGWTAPAIPSAWASGTNYAISNQYVTRGGSTYKSTEKCVPSPPPFNTGFTYALGARTTYSSARYVCILAITAPGAWTGATNWASETYVASTGKDPLTEPTYWTFVAPFLLKAAASYNIYRGRNGSYGLVGTSKTPAFNDDGQVPSWEDAPPGGRNPLSGSGNYPSCGCFFQQRLVTGGADNMPNTIETSQVGAFRNFDLSVPAKDSDAITLKLAAKQLDEIRAVFSLSGLLILTANAEWVAMGGADGPLTPSSFDLRTISYWGTSWLDPLGVGDSVIFAGGKDTAVREMVYDRMYGAQSRTELSLLARHLFVGRTIVDWVYQQEPFSVIWAVGDDGVLLGLTYLREHQIAAWHRHDLGGEVENVCCVPEPGEDAVYLVVRRFNDPYQTWARYVERMADREYGDDERDAWFVDCGLRFDGRVTNGTYLSLAGSSFQVDSTLTATATLPAEYEQGIAYAVGDYCSHGSPLAAYVCNTAIAAADSEAWTSGHWTASPRFSSTDIGGMLFVEDTDPPIALLITGYTSATVVTVRALADVPAEVATLVSKWSKGLKTFTGLDHLEGSTLAVTADGNVHRPVSVTSGTITLDRPAAVVTAGLPITAVFETLDLNIPTPTSLRARKKIVSKVNLEVEATKGLWVGEPDGTLRENKTPSLTMNSPVASVTDILSVLCSSALNYGGRIRVEQRDPLPASVLAIEPEVSVGG